MTEWLFNGLPVEHIEDQYYGFVYEIENKVSGRKYIGKKIAKFKKKLPPLKGKKRKRIKYVESDWRTYWGSCKPLLEDLKELGVENFTRTILSFHTTKAASTFREIELQFERNVLYTFNENNERVYYNDNISGSHYFRPEILEEKNET